MTEYPSSQKISFSKKWHLFWHTHERHVSTIAFIAGFIWDNIMLRRIDVLLDHLFFAVYYSITFFGIVMYNAFESREMQGKKRPKFADWFPFIIQFSFGALFSGFFVFYSRSASLFTSWPFLIFLLLLLFGNEHVRRHYAKLTFQVVIFSIVTFSYFTFLVPIVVHKMGPAEFIVSGIVSLVVILVLLYALFRTTQTRYLKSRPLVLLSVVSVYIVFNVLYFTNIIPPIPLSLKEIGIYQSVIRLSDGNYRIGFEPHPWYDISSHFTTTLHHEPNTSVFAYSAVFAPTDLNVTIFHKWFFYDESTKKWIETNRIPYFITGGGNSGFRGYTLKENITQGKWRVDVVTERDQLLGRITFAVQDVAIPPTLTFETH